MWPAYGGDRVALPHDDFRRDPRGTDDFSDRRGDNSLDTKALLLLDRGLDAAPLDEFRGHDQASTPPATGLRRHGGRRSAAPPALRELSSITTRYVRIIPAFLHAARVVASPDKSQAYSSRSP